MTGILERKYRTEKLVVINKYVLESTSKLFYSFDVHVTIHRDKFLLIKSTKCTNFSNLFLE
jgi:hypothetical protein